MSVAGRANALNIMPYAEIKPGMMGEGRTVFKGHTVETFTFTVVDTMEEMGPSGGGLILFKGTSENLRQNYGVSQGMSGSPLYIKGRLIGAVSLAFPSGDPMIGGATPIGEMMAVLSNSKEKKPVKTGYLIPGYGEAKLASSPIFVAGASPRAFDELGKQLFRNYGGANLISAAAAGGGGNGAETVLPGIPEPGSMITVNMLLGDVSVFSAGTVTAVLGDRILAFGHSFRRVGPIQFAMGRGEVSMVMKARDVPYKMVKPSGLYGRMDEDRGVAMVGTLKKYPSFTRIRVRTRDRSRNLYGEQFFRAVTDDKASLEVTRTALFSAMDAVLDRIGEGTSEVSFSVKVRGQKKPIIRSNTFYNPVDIAAESVRELDLLLRFLSFNEFKELVLDDILLGVDASSDENSMVVKRVSLQGPDKKGKGGLAESTEVDDSGRKTIILKKKFGADMGKGEGKGKAVEEEDEDGDEEPNRKLSSEEKAEKAKKEPSLTIHPGQSFQVKVTLLPYRNKPVTKTLKVKMDRNKYPPGEYAFSIGAKELRTEEEENAKEAPLTFEEALEEFYELEKNDNLVLECRTILPLGPRDPGAKKPKKEGLRQTVRVKGFAISGKRTFKVTVKNRDKVKQTQKLPRKTDPKKLVPNKIKKVKPDEGRKSRLDPPKKKKSGSEELMRESLDRLEI